MSDSGAVLSGEASQQQSQTETKAETKTETSEASWRDSLPEDIRGEASLQNFTDIAGLAKSYLHANKMIGADKVPVPGKYATDEDWAKVWNKLGRPESHEKYELKLGEGMEIADKDFYNGYLQKAHAAGLNTNQAQALFDYYNEHETTHAKVLDERQTASVREGIDNLKKEWGEGYDKNVNMAKLVLKEYGHEGLVDHLNDSWGNDPQLIKLLANIGSNLKEDEIKGEAITGMGGKTPEQAQAEIRAIQNDPKHPAYDKMHPDHEAAVKDLQRLFQMAHPA